MSRQTEAAASSPRNRRLLKQRDRAWHVLIRLCENEERKEFVPGIDEGQDRGGKIPGVARAA